MIDTYCLSLLEARGVQRATLSAKALGEAFSPVGENLNHIFPLVSGVASNPWCYLA